MSAFTNIINRAKNAETLHDKSQLLTYLGRGLAPAKKKMTAADRDEISTFVLSELEVVPTLLNKAACYREKDEIFGIMDSLMNLVMICYDSPAAVPPDRLEMIKRVVERYDRERFLEMAIDEAFKGNPTEADMERILCMASPLKDEFHKGQLWQGLIHYKGQVNTLSNDAKAVLARYAVSELTRFAEARREGTFTEEMKDQLEFICDAAGCLMFRAPVNSELVSLIGDLFELKDGDISYYALSTLLSVGEKVSDEVIVTLAKDIGEEYLSDELFGGVCEGCIDERRHDFEMCARICGSEKTEIKINALIATILDIDDIEAILYHYIKEKCADVDCSAFIDDGDIDWFGETLAEEVKKDEQTKS